MKSKPDHLLIVDDNEMNRDMLARRLSRKGYNVIVAENAVHLVVAAICRFIVRIAVGTAVVYVYAVIANQGRRNR